MPTDTPLAETGIDAVALKPTEVDVCRATDLPVDAITIDYEGNEHVPAADLLATLAADLTVRVTTPVRADGFDPLGDDDLDRRLPDTVGRVVIAGNPAYLTDEECKRPIAPRLRAAVDAAADPWVGTESVERIALAVGGTQFELLSRRTERDVRALRAAGFDGRIAVYAPTVLTDDEDAILNALGEFVSRRGPVKRALPAEATTDAAAAGRARNVLLQAADDFALVGPPADISDRVDDLRDAGADLVVAYPARGFDPVLGCY
jgi:hypothetical protein